MTTIHGSYPEDGVGVARIALSVVQTEIDVCLGHVREKDEVSIANLRNGHRVGVFVAIDDTLRALDGAAGVTDGVLRELNLEDVRLPASECEFKPAGFVGMIRIDFALRRSRLSNLHLGFE